MKKKILIVLSILFGLMFINAGLNKFFNYMPPPDDMPDAAMKIMGTFMEIGWLFPLVAVIEIVAGILVMTNRFRALGALMIFPVMVGIVLNGFFGVPSTMPIALILFAINLWMLYENREKLAPLFQ